MLPQEHLHGEFRAATWLISGHIAVKFSALRKSPLALIEFQSLCAAAVESAAANAASQSERGHGSMTAPAHQPTAGRRPTAQQ